MTGPYAVPPLHGQPRVSHADLTVHYADGNEVLMQVDAARVTVEYRRDRYNDIVSWADPSPIRSYGGAQEVTITLDGYLGRPEFSTPKPAAFAPAPATAWSDTGADPIANLRRWAQRMRDEAFPQQPEPALSAAPDIADVPELADLVDE